MNAHEWLTFLAITPIWFAGLGFLLIAAKLEHDIRKRQKKGPGD
jgi:hypothetical protein